LARIIDGADSVVVSARGLHGFVLVHHVIVFGHTVIDGDVAILFGPLHNAIGISHADTRGRIDLEGRRLRLSVKPAQIVVVGAKKIEGAAIKV
jgi:hypothetical protein